MNYSLYSRQKIHLGHTGDFEVFNGIERIFYFPYECITHDFWGRKVSRECYDRRSLFLVL